MKGKRTAEKERKKGVSNKLLIILLIVVIIIVAVLLVMKILNDRKTEDVQNENIANEIEVVELQPEPEPQIVAGTDRPIAVMIDNHESAWPQAGLNDAYIVYEIIVEGGETRLMPIFKGKSLEKIGPIRSARHYFLDYAMENDAIYVHYGQSPQAESDISSFDIDNINGLVQSSSDFWRDKGKYAPHNAVSSTEKILKIANQKEYRTSSDAESVLNYVAKEFDLENGETATDVKIPVSTLQKVEYKYDPERKVYVRYARGEKQVDWVTGEDVVTKNIIVTFADNYTLADSENKGRQGLYNIGDKEGYYITNGKAIKIICSKPSRTEKTVYKNEAGEEIEVNDGNTFIQICPTDTEVSLAPEVETPTE